MNQVVGVGVLLWLFVSMIVDMRNHNLPLWLTLAPYLLGAAYAAWNGYWPAAALAIAVILISDLSVLKSRLLFLVLLICALINSNGDNARWIALAVGLIWLVWDIDAGIWGGSDARVLIALLLFLLDVRVALFLLIGMALVGVIYRLLRKQPVPMLPGIFAGTLVFLLIVERLPASQ